MPEFLGRPNTPNQLANSLVQMASQQVNPWAELMKNIGHVADAAGGAMMGKAKDEKQFQHEKDLKQMDIDARKEEHRYGLLTELAKNGQVVESMLNYKPKEQMTAADVHALLPGAKTTGDQIGSDFGTGPRPNPAAASGIPSENMGLPPGYAITPKQQKERADANRWVTVDNNISGKFPALKGIEGKDISTAQYINLTKNHEAAERYRGTLNSKLWGRAKQMASEDMRYIQAAMDNDESTMKQVIEEKKRVVQETGGADDRPGTAKVKPRKDLGSIIADAFEKGLQ